MLLCLISFPFMSSVTKQRYRKGAWMGLHWPSTTGPADACDNSNLRQKQLKYFSQEKCFSWLSNCLKILVAYIRLHLGMIGVFRKLLIKHQLFMLIGDYRICKLLCLPFKNVTQNSTLEFPPQGYN